MRRVAAIRAREADFAAAGARLALVGSGTPEQARGFRVLSGWTGAILVDTEREAYRAADLRRMGLLSLLRPGLHLAARRARREGHRQGRVQGDAWQLGGTLVVAPGDRVLYAYRNGAADDEAPLDAVLAAVRGAAVPGR